MIATDGSECPIKPNKFYFATRLPDGKNLLVEFNYVLEKARGLIYGSSRDGEIFELVSFKEIKGEPLIQRAKKNIDSMFNLKEEIKKSERAEINYKQALSVSQRSSQILKSSLNLDNLDL
ncbi:MAG: hypothetical protein ABIH28_02345 [archaeon]